VPDASGDFSAVLFDFHAAAAAVAALAACEVRRDVGFGEGEAGGQAFDDHREALAVALAGGEESEVAHGYSVGCSARGAASAAASTAGRGGTPATGGSSIGMARPAGSRM
jgi:hypothetical protein